MALPTDKGVWKLKKLDLLTAHGADKVLGQEQLPHLVEEVPDGELHGASFRDDICCSTYEQLRGFVKRPEPVELKKGDTGKLAGLLTDGKVTEEEYKFLLRYRVELNALTPLELLRWLEAELERRDLWKTIPDEDELRQEAEARIRAELWVFADSLAYSVAEVLLEEFGLDRVQELIDEIRDYAESRAKEWIHLPEVESSATVDELIERLRQKREHYWKEIAQEIGGKESLDFKDELASQVDGEREGWVDEIGKDETVTSKLEELKQLLS